MKLFNENNNWYRGNLHTHTNISDGLLSPEDAIERYRQEGYDFMAITDHNKFYKGIEMEDFTILSGTEIHINDYKTRKAFHIVGLNMDNEPTVPKEPNPQDLIDSILGQNGLAILAHPSWSMLSHEDALDLKGYMGMEIWNTVSETGSNRGSSESYVDTVASKGCIKALLAVDDTHFYSDDLFGGYIMLNSPSLKTEDIVENIKKHNFYATQGPIIKQITVKEDRIHIETSPVEQISFMSDNFYDADRVQKCKDKPLESATYIYGENDTWVRIECIDSEGKKAWSQIIII
ncbi:MAG: CehA/McbA family metallohydrolase [Clostridiales bacterium]|nr:CehA/McbA family metallohydrolase [Clostridiales bacterium]